MNEDDDSLDLPYKFVKMEGGKFTRISSYGSISVQGFSGLSIAVPMEAPLQYMCCIFSRVRIKRRFRENYEVDTWCSISVSLDYCRQLHVSIHITAKSVVSCKCPWELHNHSY